MKSRYVVNMVRISASGDLALVGVVLLLLRLASGRGDLPHVGELREEDDVLVQNHPSVVTVDVDGSHAGRVRQVLITERVRTGLLGVLLDLVAGVLRQQGAGLARVALREPREGAGGSGRPGWTPLRCRR
jgi:hypothetical protein